MRQLYSTAPPPPTPLLDNEPPQRRSTRVSPAAPSQSLSQYMATSRGNTFISPRVIGPSTPRPGIRPGMERVPAVFVAPGGSRRIGTEIAARHNLQQRADIPCMSCLVEADSEDTNTVAYNDSAAAESRRTQERNVAAMTINMDHLLQEMESTSGMHTIIQARQDPTRQEQTRQEQAMQKQARHKKASQEQARLDPSRLEEARQEQARQKKARQEQARPEKARLDPARVEGARLDPARLEEARQEQAKQKQARQKEASQIQARQKQARQGQSSVAHWQAELDEATDDCSLSRSMEELLTTIDSESSLERMSSDSTCIKGRCSEKKNKQSVNVQEKSKQSAIDSLEDLLAKCEEYVNKSPTTGATRCARKIYHETNLDDSSSDEIDWG